MKRQSILVSLLLLVTSLSLVCSTAHAQTPATVGQWSLGPVWDITPINMLILPSGKVMFYPGFTIYGDDARLWDPATNTLTSLAKAGYDIFCNGHSFLMDGTILFTGGTLSHPNTGIAYASIYNPVTNVWTRVPDMNAGRWYPSSTSTGLGDVLVMTGWVDDVQHENALPQVWQPSSGTWRSLTTALLKLWTYSWVYWTPSGKAIVVGPDPTTRYLDISGTGSWTSAGAFNYPNVRDYGSSVLYSSSKILIAGGGDPPTNTAEIFDLNAGTWQYTNPMANKRRQFNLVLLPDDNVLAVGGTSGPGFNDQTSPVYASEMWNTSTKTWTTMASQTVGRFYHSVAVLLPDGRVLSGGGTDAYQTEFYSPPYLFKGARPTITSAPSAVPYSGPFFVGTPNATSIAKVRLIRLPANTHAFDQNQRILPISFTQGTGGLNLTAPSDPNQAPVGHYMLFILNGSGVPSVAKIIQLGVSPTPPAAPTGLVATAAFSTTINLAWTDQSNNETSFKIERKTGTGNFAQIATVGANVTTYADNGLAASTTYSYRMRASNTAGNSAYSNTASATTQAGGTAPAAPTGLSATAASSTTINLAWTDQSNNETSFKIERKTGTGNFAQIATVGASVTTYADNGLAASTTYSYRVRASNNAGDSAYSNTASATTQAASAPSLRLNGGTSPITVAPGATITITVVNPTGNPKDWIGIYLVGQSSGTKSVVEHYVTWTSGYTIPSTTPVGTYEARLFSNDSLTLLATSATITVSQ